MQLSENWFERDQKEIPSSKWKLMPRNESQKKNTLHRGTFLIGAIIVLWLVRATRIKYSPFFPSSIAAILGTAFSATPSTHESTSRLAIFRSNDLQDWAEWLFFRCCSEKSDPPGQMRLFNPLVVSAGHFQDAFKTEFSGNFQRGIGFHHALTVKDDISIRLGRFAKTVLEDEFVWGENMKNSSWSIC